MDSKQLIRLVKNDVLPISARLNAFHGLNLLDTPESSLAICQFALSGERKFAKIAKELIIEFSYAQIAGLLSFILSSGGYSRKNVFNLLYELKERDVLRYILEEAESISSDENNRGTLALWLRQLGITEKFIQGMLRLPTDLAMTFGKTLKKVDKDVHKEIVKFAKGGVSDSAQDMSIRAMDVLLEIVDGDEIAPFLVSLLNIQEPKTRSKAVNLVNRISNKLPYIKKALLDDDDRVRANAVEALSGDDSEEAQSLLITYLYDHNNRIRANTAKVLYEMGNILGFQTLMKMVAEADMMMRASAAWVLGELKAIWAAKELHNLADDEDEIVSRNAQLALEKIGEDLLELTERFTAMGKLVEPIDVPYGFDEFRCMAEFLLTLEPEIQVEMVQNISAAHPSVISEMLDNWESKASGHASTSFILASIYSVNNYLRSKAVLVVGQRCEQEFFFERFMKDSDVRVVANVIESLWGRRLDFAPSVLKIGLNYADNRRKTEVVGFHRVIANAAIGLHKIGAPIGASTLISLLSNPEPAMRASAAWGLGEIRATGVIDKLKNLQRDQDESVRLNATLALEKVTQAAARLAKEPSEFNVKINHVDTSALPGVLLYVSVKNALGQPINDLAGENFIIAENDIVSERNPRLTVNTDSSMRSSVAILMDYSGSMVKADIRATQLAAQSFTSQMSPYDRGCVIKFSGEVDIVQDFTSDKRLLLNSIKKRYHSESDGTALYDSMYAAVEQLRHEGNCIKSIVALTDGDDSGKEQSLDSLIQFALDQNVSVYTIGLGSEVDSRLSFPSQFRFSDGNKNILSQIAISTGGSYYHVGDTNWLEAIYQTISKTLKSHYVISYMTTQEKVATLKVNVKYGDLTAVDTISLINRGT